MPHRAHFTTTIAIAIAFLTGAIAPASAAPVAYDFEIFGTKRGLQEISQPISEGAVTLSPVYGHFDVMIDRALHSSGSTAVGIHNGASGSGIRFSFAKTLLALSFDVSGWIFANNGTPDATVTSSAGGNFTILNGTTGVIDLTRQTGFSAVDWIQVTMPSPESNCVFFGNNRSLSCSSIYMDRLIADAAAVPLPPVAAVPLPAGFPLLVGAIGFVRLLRRRRTR